MTSAFYDARRQTAFFFVLLFLAAAGCGPSDEGEFIRNGKRLVDDGKFIEAIAEFAKEIKSNPQNTKAYLYRGKAYIQKGDLDEALKDYDRAIKINPNLAEGYQARAALYFARFNYKRSWENLLKAKELGCKIDISLLHSLEKEYGKDDEDFFGAKK